MRMIQQTAAALTLCSLAYAVREATTSLGYRLPFYDLVVGVGPETAIRSVDIFLRFRFIIAENFSLSVMIKPEFLTAWDVTIQGSKEGKKLSGIRIYNQGA